MLSVMTFLVSVPNDVVLFSVLALVIVGAEHLLTPGNILLYELIWMIPGLLITEWTRSV